MTSVSRYTLEIACFSLEAAVLAAKAGADRIELCHDYLAGGLSPTIPPGFSKTCLGIPLFMMVRPRGGNFVYTRAEFETMKQTIECSRKTGADGIVFGVLSNKKSVDKKRCKELVEMARGMDLTFHRAFDETVDPLRALEDIMECGFHRILTSGQRPRAIEGTALISELVERAQNSIIIMPGGGIRSNNIDALIRETGAKEFHSSAIHHGGQCDSMEIQRLKKKLNS